MFYVLTALSSTGLLNESHTILYMYKAIKEKRIKHPLIKLTLPALPLPCHASHGKNITKSSTLPQGSSKHPFSSLKVQKLLLNPLLNHLPKGPHHSGRASQPDMLLQCNTYEFSLSLLLSNPRLSAIHPRLISFFAECHHQLLSVTAPPMSVVVTERAVCSFWLFWLVREPRELCHAVCLVFCAAPLWC